MIQAKVINKINFPTINLQSTLLEIADEIIIQDMKNGIANSRAIIGGMFPHLEPETIKRKGHDRPLVDSGELKESFSYRPLGKDRVVISIDSGRRKIGSYLQKGIDTKNGPKQFIFFGISKDAHARAMRYAKAKVRELTNG